MSRYGVGMLKFLRTGSLKALSVSALAAMGLLVAGAMIASGAASNDSKPAPKPLAQAVSDSFAAKSAFTGVSARVTFTNAMLDSSGITGGVDPLTGGGSGRFWADAEGKFRIELQSDGGGGDVQVVSDGKQIWISHGASGKAWKATLPKYDKASDSAGKSTDQWPPSVAAVAKAIKSLSGDATISAAQPDNVGGRPAYTVTITPKDTSGLFAGGRVSWDAENGAPLAVAVLAKGQAEPVIDLRATSVDFGPVASAVFDMAAPANAESIDLASAKSSLAAKQKSKKGMAEKRAYRKPVTGLNAVQAKVAFKISAPDTLAGKARSQVTLVGSGKDAGAVVTYGEGMSTVAVLEMPEAAKPQAGVSKPADERAFALPTSKVGGVEGTKVATPLGALATFVRDGVRYTVAGSVTDRTITQAANGI